jgi:hypothetical protein
MREIEIIDQGDGFAFSKRTNGFVPKTIFIKEFSADPRIERVVMFFQEFGVPSPKDLWWSIDEPAEREITWSTVYDLHNKLGGFSGVDLGSFLLSKGSPEREIAWLLAHGYVLPSEGGQSSNQYAPVWPPRPELVVDDPEWRSFVTDEAQEEADRRFWNLEINSRVRKACPMCAEGVGLIILDLEYVHWTTKSRQCVPCGAAKIHRERKTLAKEFLTNHDGIVEAAS